MVMSMTGYGGHVIEYDETTISVEVRTVNSRYLDFVPKTPRSFNFLEAEIKQIVQDYFHRGRIEVYLFLSGNHFVEKSLQVDWDMMDQYIHQLKEAQERYSLKGDIPISILTQVEGLFNVQESEKNLERLKEPVLEAIKLSCEKVSSVREQEGKYLLHDIKKRLENVESMLNSLRDHQEDVSVLYRERIEKRIKEYLKNKVSIDTDRIYQEVVLLAEKGDITEEITRLSSHIKQFKSIVKVQDAIGRQLDFIIQEMHREINTIGAKSVDATISKSVVTIKSDIEKIKEQIQNIE